MIVMDINFFKTKLLEEKKKLEQSMEKIARKNPNEPGDWEVKPEDLNIMTSDQSEMADSIEDLADITAAEEELESRLREVNAALIKIEKNAYGKCEVDGGNIEEERLEADPAATTCIKHADHI